MSCFPVRYEILRVCGAGIYPGKGECNSPGALMELNFLALPGMMQLVALTA
jgi:hypothetical protein